MKNFIGLVRDTLASKNPEGTWQWAKNILLTKGNQSISNEDGIKFQYLINGTVIGFIATNRHIVYFIKNEEGVDEIGVVNTNNNTPTYTTVLKTNLLNFQLNCPIEGIFVYNYKGELIISWCDGVYINSNKPGVLNIDNPPFEINPDGTLVDPSTFSLIRLNPNIYQGNMNISYLDTGTFGGYSVYITYSYVYNDDTLVGYFSTSDLAYVGNNFNPIDKYGIRLNFTNLDENFTKIKIGIIVKTEGDDNNSSTLVGYESIIIDYTGTTLQYDIISLDRFIESLPEAILLEKAYITKANTITKQNNQSFLGNVELGSNIKFQKYANLIKLVPVEYIEEEDNFNDNKYSMLPSFMPDEVYSIYIQLQKLDGSYTEAFHIPNRIAEGDELEDITASQITNYDLDWLGELTTPKQFHLFNNGVVRSMVKPSLTTPNPSPVDESINKFGYWENTETYPNNDEYNSTIDYEGNPIIGGEDLRNTPIRYHRFPSLESMADNTLESNGDPVTLLRNRWGIPTGSGYRRPRKLGIKITNIEDIIPISILNQIQGYRLCHIKRTTSNSLVAGNWVGIRRRDFGDPLEYSGTAVNPIDYEYYDFAIQTSGTPQDFVKYDKLRVLGNELFKFRPSLSPTYIKVNYKFNLPTFSIDEGGFTYVNTNVVYSEGLEIADTHRFSNCENSLIYRPGNSISENTQYSAEGINLTLKNNFGFKDWADHFPAGTSAADISASTYPAYVVLNLTAFNYKLNLYTGFNSDSLNVIGRTSTIVNNQIFKRGDNFTNSKVDIYTRGLHRVENYSGGSNAITTQIFAPIVFEGLNSSVNGSVLTTSVPSSITTNDPVVLDTYDYDFSVEGAESLNSIKDLITIFTFDIESTYVTKFPYRIYKGLKIPNESLSLNSLSTYNLEDYYEMPNDKGEIIALRGSERKLFIQHRFSLFVAAIKDTLKTDNVDAYLGTSDLFYAPPTELYYDEKGYIGSVSKFACQVIRGMYITINQINGKIFIVDNSVKEISNKGNKNWFWNNWDNGLGYFYTDDNGEKRRIDNPFISVGHLVAYDKEYNRLIFTKKLYEYRFPELIGEEVGEDIANFDGEFYSINGVLLDFNDPNEFINKSKTLSYNLDENMWVCEHDYFPNITYYTSNGLFSLTNNIVGNNRASNYIHNNKLTKGTFYGSKYDSYVDLIFNQNLDVTKLLQSIGIIIEVHNNTGGIELHKTISHIMVYNNNQCSGIINLKDNHFKLTRLANGEWNIHDFRDMVINPNSPIINDNGAVNNLNLNNIKVWFEKSNFISKFIVIRLIMDNTDNNTVYIHEVKTKSIINKR